MPTTGRPARSRSSSGRASPRLRRASSAAQAVPNESPRTRPKAVATMVLGRERDFTVLGPSTVVNRVRASAAREVLVSSLTSVVSSSGTAPAIAADSSAEVDLAETVIRTVSFWVVADRLPATLRALSRRPSWSTRAWASWVEPTRRT